MEYKDFLASKRQSVIESGFKAENLNSNLFDFQAYIVSRACEMGKFAIFADCGLGKTLMLPRGFILRLNGRIEIKINRSGWI